MGFKHILEKIGESYQEKKQKRSAQIRSDIDKGRAVEELLSKNNFNILKEVFEELEQEYDRQAVETKDVTYLAKKSVFVDVLNELNSIVSKAKVLDKKYEDSIYTR